MESAIAEVLDDRHRCFVENHIIAYAAKVSRSSHQTVNMEEFKNEIYANL